MSVLFKVKIPSKDSFTTTLVDKAVIYSKTWVIENKELLYFLPDETPLILEEDDLRHGQIKEAGVENIKTVGDLRKRLENIKENVIKLKDVLENKHAP